MEVFFMSKCPDCAEFTKTILGDLMKDVGSLINFIPQYVLKYDKQAQYHFKSLHGTSEVIGDLYEECAYHKYDQAAFVTLLKCLDSKYYNIPYNFEECAKEAKMDFSMIKNCGEGQEGFEYLWAAANRTEELGVRYAPTIYMNDDLVCIPGVQCKIKDESDVSEWVKYVCDLYKGEKPPVCG